MGNQRIRSMEELAAVSGISRPTLSKYFNDPSSVRGSTRERIEKALERHDYRPNIYAINQNRRLTKNVGIVVPYLADPFFAEIVRVIEGRCIAAGFSPLLFSAHGDPRLETEILDTLRLLRPAGVLLAPLGRASDRRALETFCRDVPTVLFDSNIDGIGEAFVGSDNRDIVGKSVAYLCRTGEPPCFFEMANPVNPNAHLRREVYVEAMTALGHEPQVISVPGEGWQFEAIGHREGLRIIEQRLLRSDTVLCSNDRLAIGLLSACYQKGLRIGHGPGSALRVAGHDDHPFAAFTAPTLTTVAQNYAAISERSAETLFALVEGGGSPSSRSETLFSGRLVQRASA